ncbi:MAG: type IV toxin-antitoxin system AbiEi family antitoxin domain-containing protein [Planctomycetota bacterium]
MARKAGVIKHRDVTQQGIHPEYIRRLVKAGELERVSRGVYRLAEAEITEYHPLTVVAGRIPRGVVCLLSALRFHELGTQSPGRVWVALDRRAAKPKLTEPKIHVVRFSGAAFTRGIETHRLEGVDVKVYRPAKTVADCFKYRNKVGLDVALEALKAVLHERKAAVDELLEFADICRVRKIMQPYLEAVV